MGDKIDFNLLATVLNAGVTVILLGGLIIGISTAQLIMIGVLGYAMSFLFRRIGSPANRAVSGPIKFCLGASASGWLA